MFRLPKLIASVGVRATHSPSLSSLTAVSGIDGRYSDKTHDLREYFSEHGLIKARTEVEVAWLRFMAATPEIKEVPQLSSDALQALNDIMAGFGEKDSAEIKGIEAVTNHDVKAVEYYLKSKFEHNSELRAVAPFLHFACTSEDINNLAYALMVTRARKNVILPQMRGLVLDVEGLAAHNASKPMLSRTHGQPATPTTLGKEMANFSYRLSRQTHQVNEVEITGKFNGAVGNYNAHAVAYPEIDWPKTGKAFVESLGVHHSPYTTQIEPHDWIAELSHAMSRYNTVLLGFNRDVWTYISLGYFKQKVVAQEVGSSTMPHKVNPIDFENSEGNVGLANAVFAHLAEKLPVSRLQRDLSDSTVLRSLGLGFAHSMIAYRSVRKGITKLQVNDVALAADLDKNWEVLGEAIQTLLRKHGSPNAYERLKELTRGQSVGPASMKTFIQSLELPDDAKQRLLELTPHTYTGYAAALTAAVKSHNLK